jgi:hypothetical protein
MRSPGGKATVSEIAQALLAEDQAQLEHYREITKRIPVPCYEGAA